MYAQRTVHFDLRIATRSKSTLHSVERKNRIRKAIGLQYVSMHLPVTRTFSSLSTSHIDRDLAACPT